MKLKSEFLNEIKERGFVYQDIEIEELDKIITKNKISGYIGFDITSDSLHVGSLIHLKLIWIKLLLDKLVFFTKMTNYSEVVGLLLKFKMGSKFAKFLLN